ncbi:hypothetical protein UPYG_G00254280 [Umbra pygmaea]|uniref:Uncharacterized protein n=1 Tax=Umbra pygmaea TaxID=75934 RepID=A0ABD0WV92_UMBPY
MLNKLAYRQLDKRVTYQQVRYRLPPISSPVGRVRCPLVVSKSLKATSEFRALTPTAKNNGELCYPGA